ncbi:MAG: hypothetical protein ACLTID_12955 [Barnesiella sp.]
MSGGWSMCCDSATLARDVKFLEKTATGQRVCVQWICFRWGTLRACGAGASGKVI